MGRYGAMLRRTDNPENQVVGYDLLSRRACSGIFAEIEKPRGIPGPESHIYLEKACGQDTMTA